jgi:hypothetical protein
VIAFQLGMLSALGDNSGEYAGNNPFGQPLPPLFWAASSKHRALLYYLPLQSIVASLTGDKNIS